MRRITLLFILVGLCFVAAQAHTYETSSALRSGHIVKLQVGESGIYMLTYEQIQAFGLDPKKVRLLGYGGNVLPQDFTQPRVDDVPSLPFYMHTGADGVFSAGDYILFYANGPVGWSWNNLSGYFTRTRNWYADYGCYFISDGAGEQNLMQTAEPIEGWIFQDATTYTALQLHELDQRNLVDVTNGAEGGGREWYGEKLTPTSPTLTIPFTFADVVSDQELLCRADVAAASSEMSTMKVTVAGKTTNGRIDKIPVSDFYTMAVPKTVTVRTSTANTSLPVTLTYESSVNSANAYVNFIEMQVPCSLRLQGNVLYIRNTENVGSVVPSRYHLLGADTNTQIWNMTHPTQATIMPTEWQGDTLCWIGDNTEAQFFIAVRTNATSWPSPASRGDIANQNLHAQLKGKQHIIITPEVFRFAAERLKQVHEQYSTDRWAVVSDEEVYNEFSSGTPDATAYRWLMKYIYDTTPVEDLRPMSLLLFGDGTFDNRKILKTSGPALLLTYEASNSYKETDAYATDDYFGWLNDEGGIYSSYWDDKRARMQISVGRLPIRTADEASAMVDKIALYLSNTTAGSWKQQLCFLADDGDNGMHTACTDTAAKRVRNVAPNYILNKIYLDSYVQETSASGESYPIAYNMFCNLLQSGILFMDYAGHGSANNICSEMFLTRKQVESMVNANQGLWALATCNFAHFDQAEQSTAEVAVLNPNGGAIAVMSADRTVYASDNEVLNKYYCENLFYHDDPFTYPYSIGEALRLAKNQNGDKMNKLPFVLLGDPSIKLNHPCQYEVRISEMPDTLHALDLVTIHGFITNSLDSVVHDTAAFNGTLTITVYDKAQIIATRDNDEPDESKKHIMYFQDYPNKLFVGEADVVDGRFTLQFRIPKDIRYSIGCGRITLYAIGEDASGIAEAMGYKEDFLVGGSSPWVIDDTKGPDMTLYLNSPLFNDGDCVNPTPHFFASLYDENGINTIGSGIGHDLQLVLDNSPKQTYVLNNYYTADNNSYQSGTVSYLLPELTNGNHSLSFQAWDLLNNATTKTIGFSVDNTQGPVVQKVIVYPNPVSQFGTIHMNIVNDRPDDMLDVSIAFYDLSGRLMWSTRRNLYDNLLSLDIAEAGLKQGTYIYQFTIQTSTQTSSKHSGRLIVY